MSARAFVIGNVVFDETLHAAALPSPGASIHVRRGTAGLGGKGANQAVVLARAGIDVSFLAAIGTDARGETVVSILRHDDLDAGLVCLANVDTDWSAVLVTESGDNAILTTRAASHSLDVSMVTHALRTARPGDLCVLQANLSFETTAAAIELAKARGMVIALNPSPFVPEFAELFANIDVLFVNSDEALAFTGQSDAAAAARLLAEGSRVVILTCGAEGVLLASNEGIKSIPATPANLVDPTGAGDTFMATALAHAAANSWRPDTSSLVVASRAAALTVGRAGTFVSLPSRQELASIMSAS